MLRDCWVIAIAAILWVAAARAETDVPQPGPEGPAADEGSLSEMVQTYEEGEKDIQALRDRLRQAKTATEVKRLRKEVERLESAQNKRAEALEKLVGPLPPAVAPESVIPLEEKIRAQERRHETVLESNVEKRLP